MNEPSRNESLHSTIITGTETLPFFGLDQKGSIKVSELFWMFERLLLGWWPKFIGMKREDFWSSTGHFLVARHTHVRRLLPAGTPGEVVATQVHTLMGCRQKKDSGREYGGINRFEVSRKSDNAVVASLDFAWTWVDASSGAPKIAAAAPSGLPGDKYDLPPIEEVPAIAAAEPAGAFTWSLRETDPNRHITFMSYLERAENIIADKKSERKSPVSWEVWFRRECRAGETMNVSFANDSEDRQIIALENEADGQRRVVLRHASIESN